MTWCIRLSEFTVTPLRFNGKSARFYIRCGKPLMIKEATDESYVTTLMESKTLKTITKRGMKL